MQPPWAWHNVQALDFDILKSNGGGGAVRVSTLLWYNEGMRNNKGQFIKGHRASTKTEFKKGEHWRSPKAHWQKQWLYQKYVIEEMSAQEIAVLQECTEANILYWMKKHEIERRTISEARDIKHWGSEGEENGMFGIAGEDNPNWKGGITPERQSLYASQEWKQAAKYVRNRDRNLCQLCGDKHTHKNILHIHHVISFEVVEARADPNNLVLLCRDCHSWAHSNKNIERRFIG